MNGSCSLHSPGYINDSACVVEASVEDPMGGVPLTLRATRKTVFHRYTRVLVEEGEPDVIYQNTADILEISQHCAKMILSDLCDAYVVAEQIKTEYPRIITRQALAQFPDKYRPIN